MEMTAPAPDSAAPTSDDGTDPSMDDSPDDTGY
jgi:hypothetical protein